MDNHSVGSQPVYDILRSGSPSDKKESFSARVVANSARKGLISIFEELDWVHFIMFIVMIFFVALIMRLQAQVASASLNIQTLQTLLTMNRPRQE
jgi:hypothetical protein